MSVCKLRSLRSLSRMVVSTSCSRVQVLSMRAAMKRIMSRLCFCSRRMRCSIALLYTALLIPSGSGGSSSSVRKTSTSSWSSSPMSISRSSSDILVWPASAWEATCGTWRALREAPALALQAGPAGEVVSPECTGIPRDNQARPGHPRQGRRLRAGPSSGRQALLR